MSEVREKLESAVKECYSTWGESYYKDYYGKNAPYPPVHSHLLKDILLKHGTKTLLDAGCGPASFLRDLADTNMELFGFDLTPEMVDSGKKVFKSLSLPSENIWQGSVLEMDAYGERAGSFDAALCVGVLPHIAPENDIDVIRNLRESVRPGGLVAVEARNSLFSLFTFNRYTYDFVVDQLVKPESINASSEEKEKINSALEDLKSLFRMDLPPVRKGKEGEPGYDEVLSRTHVPFELQKMFEQENFHDIKISFYHYHSMPPLLEGQLPDLFKHSSLNMENPEDWRGYFMASAFVISGIKS